jgi:hypothetical protein
MEYVNNHFIIASRAYSLHVLLGLLLAGARRGRRETACTSMYAKLSGWSLQASRCRGRTSNYRRGGTLIVTACWCVDPAGRVKTRPGYL